MGLRITIDMFSGRPNPVVELNDEESKDLMRRLQPAGRVAQNQSRLPESVLGYRGLVIEQTNLRDDSVPAAFRVADGILFGNAGAYRIADQDFENFVCGSTGPIHPKLSNDFPLPLLPRQIELLHQLRLEFPYKKLRWPVRVVCGCAPLYEPTWWNDGSQKQLGNNCYNYASNYRSNTFAQPGLSAGAMYASLTGPDVLAGAVADCLIDDPKADNKCPGEGHLVALVIAPGIDFHWYRLGRNGYWTHKPGSTPATNVDNSGALITDPRTANRGMYTEFRTFMVVMHGHIKIG